MLYDTLVWVTYALHIHYYIMSIQKLAACCCNKSKPNTFTFHAFCMKYIKMHLCSVSCVNAFQQK